MSSLSIILHALRMVFFNLGASLRIGLPVLIAVIAQPFVMAQLLDLSLGEAIFYEPGFDPVTGMMDWNDYGIFIGLSLLVGFVAMFSIVGWHRYVLLEELPGALGPRAPLGRVLAYLAALILLVLLVILPMMAVGVGAGFVGEMMGDPGMTPDALGTLVVVAIVPVLLVVYVVMLRISLILPAAAIGNWMGPFKAYGHTRGHLGVFAGLMLWGLVFGLVVAVVVIGVAFALIESGALSGMIGSDSAAVIGIVLYALVQVLVTLIGASILTTLYGVMVEGRSIADDL